MDQIIEANIDDEVQLKFGESVEFEEGRFSVKFKSLEDSRCPQGAYCIYKGNAKVFLEVSQNEVSKETVVLNTNSQDGPKEIAVGDYNIELQGVYPYPKAGVENPMENYSIWIIVRKK
jgi:hypothetical protein